MSAQPRIVSLIPSSTESVVALGGGRLVGCTRYCTEPAFALRDVPRVGGTKNPALERIAALAPDLVLVNGEENRRPDIDWLRARFRVLEQTPTSVALAVAALRELAAVLGGAAEAAVGPMAQAIEAARAAALADASVARRRAFYPVWCKPWMGVNATTFVHDVLQIAGVDNVTADLPARYPEVTPAAIAANGVDVVLLPDEPWRFDAVQRDELAAARTFGSAQLRLCSGRDFCWHGVHLATGLPRAVAQLRSRPAHL